MVIQIPTLHQFTVDVRFVVYIFSTNKIRGAFRVLGVKQEIPLNHCSSEWKVKREIVSISEIIVQAISIGSNFDELD